MRFSPLKRRFALQIESGEMEYIDSKNIAYIAFHAEHDAKHERVKPRKTVPRIIHTVTSDVFDVDLASDLPEEGIDFLAYLDKESYPFDQIYFFKQGVRLVEHPKTLGELLIDEHITSAESVKQALEQQKSLKDKPVGTILMEQDKLDLKEIESALALQKKRRKPLGEILIEAELIREEDLQRALEEQKKNRSLKVGQILINMGVVSAEEVVSSLARKFHLKFIDLDDCEIDQDAVSLIDPSILLKHQILPIKVDDNSLTIVRADPLDIEGFDNVRFQTKKRVIEYLATPKQVQKVLERELSKLNDDMEDMLLVEAIGKEERNEVEDELTEVQAAEASPIVRLVNKILINAIKQKVSDIHILPQSKKLKVLFRINGDLLEQMVLEKWLQRRVISRIKLLSGMNIAEHRLTQDGRMMIYHEGVRVELRVSCIPNASGESIVMRVLDKEMAVDLESLGLREQDRKALMLMAKKPFGLILSTGPTGSGKSTTLFSILKKVIHSPLHVLTIEDPIESEIEGANQVQVNAKVGLTFAQILRNVLRHDPDVIMIGEMRDLETASIGIEAALTGHLMLSTLHTNSAVDTIVRFQDMGIPNYLLAPALLGVISQSLLKRLCVHCRQPLDDGEQEVYELLDQLEIDRPEKLYQAVGCDQCAQTGYSGRVMVYEFLIVSEKVRDAIHHGMIGKELEAIARQEGMIPKSEHALELAGQGVISHEDLIKMLI